jgi:translation initiation factor IF-2
MDKVEDHVPARRAPASAAGQAPRLAAAPAAAVAVAATTAAAVAVAVAVSVPHPVVVAASAVVRVAAAVAVPDSAVVLRVRSAVPVVRRDAVVSRSGRNAPNTRTCKRRSSVACGCRTATARPSAWRAAPR